MTNTIERLRREHRNLERLVSLLARQPLGEIAPPVHTIELLVDALYYLTRFPDVSHHPLEDLIAERLRAKAALLPGVSEEIEAQHATLARQGSDLMRDLESAAREETMSWALVGANIRLYGERLRHNMTVEELALFPVAEHSLDAEDWETIDMLSCHTGPDPLFPSPVEIRFVQLHRAIAAEAGCGCGDAAP